jgi:hypothetical protein
MKKVFNENKEIALKIFENDQQSKQLFEHEKNIYLLPFIQHRNVLVI